MAVLAFGFRRLVASLQQRDVDFGRRAFHEDMDRLPKRRPCKKQQLVYVYPNWIYKKMTS